LTDKETQIRQLPSLFRPDKIPNVAIATFSGGSRGVVRILFPALFVEGQTVQLHADRKADLYNNGIIPALTHVNPEDVQNWPPTYEDSLFRARNKNGTLQYGTRPLASFDVALFSQELKRRLTETHAWARDMVYLIQIKGVKEANRHNPNDYDSETALQHLLSNLDTSSGTWFVDVGLEISEPEKAYQWRTDGHAAVLQHALSVNRAQATRATSSTSNNYERDISAHLLDLSGCRIDLNGHSKGPHGVEYIQLYTTDKAVVYHLERGRHSKFMTGNQALQGQPPKFTQDLYSAFYNAGNSNDCAARVELRVPLDAAATVLLGMPDELLMESLVVFPRKVWWYVKFVVDIEN
jgi:hypothetical protein